MSALHDPDEQLNELNFSAKIMPPKTLHMMSKIQTQLNIKPLGHIWWNGTILLVGNLIVQAGPHTWPLIRAPSKKWALHCLLHNPN